MKILLGIAAMMTVGVLSAAPVNIFFDTDIETASGDAGATPAVCKTPSRPLHLRWYRENRACVAARKMPLQGDGAWLPINVVSPSAMRRHD